jgi:hypothetical protein
VTPPSLATIQKKYKWRKFNPLFFMFCFFEVMLQLSSIF